MGNKMLEICTFSFILSSQCKSKVKLKVPMIKRLYYKLSHQC